MEDTTQLRMDIRGSDVLVTVTGDSRNYTERGTFSAEVDGATYRDRTWAGLYEILHELSEGEVAVPFTMIRGYPDENGNWVQNGTARATHRSQHRTVLVTWPGGQKSSVKGASNTISQLSGDEAAELNALLNEQERIAARIAAIKTAHYIDLTDAVRQAMSARVGGQPKEET